MDFSNPDDEFLLQAQRKAKRSFLAEEIVAAGYSPDLFTMFCERRKSSDIDRWDFEELQDCVRQFKTQYRPGDEAEEEAEAEVEAPPKAAPPPEIKVTPTEDEYSLQATLLPSTALSESEQPTVVVHSFELVPASLLGRAKLFFTIDTAPLSWSVRRSNRDFIWLRSTLQIEFPGVLVPPLSDKEKFDVAWIEKRQRTLQCFCEEVLANSLFRYSPFLVSFLSEVHSRFQDSKKQSTKLRKASSVEAMPSPIGTVQCLSASSKDFFAEAGRALAQSEALHQKLKRDVLDTAESVNTLSTQVTRLSEGVKSLGEALSTLPNGNVLRDEMMALSIALSAWGKHQRRVHSVLQETVAPFFAWQSKRCFALRELLKERDMYFATYTQSEEKLNERKERLWQQGDVTKWELAQGLNVRTIQQNKELAFPCMLSKDSQAVQQNKDLFAFYNAQAKRQVAYTFTSGQVEAKQLTALADDFIECFSSVSLEWRTFKSKLESFAC